MTDRTGQDRTDGTDLGIEASSRSLKTDMQRKVLNYPYQRQTAVKNWDMNTQQ